MSEHITHARLVSVVHYDKGTGDFTWSVRLNSRSNPGERAGRVLRATKDGHTREYIVIKIDGRDYLAHRLAVFYVTGKWPDHQVDHKDGNGLNNAWENLREATNGQNQKNKKLQKSNKSGLKGVCFDSARSKWRATITVDGRHINLGRFESRDAAYAAYCRAAEVHHGEFARLK